MYCVSLIREIHAAAAGPQDFLFQAISGSQLFLWQCVISGHRHQ